MTQGGCRRDGRKFFEKTTGTIFEQTESARETERMR